MGVVGTWDTAFDNIVSALESYSTTDSAEDASYAFTVYPDYYRQHPPPQAGAYVFAYLGPIIAQRNGQSAVDTYLMMMTTYYLDCIAIAKGTQGDTYSRADEAAGARMRYLIQQVLTALYQASQRYLGLSQGAMQSKAFPRVEPLPPEMQTGERPMAGARITMEIGFPWEPGDLSGTDIDSISVDADRFTALFEYGT